MSTPLPLVSIGLPVYNGEKQLAQSLESLVGQDYPNLEIVVSDNASTDSTAEILQKFAQRDARVKVVRQERNQGAAVNFIEVLERSTGEYFMWAGCGDHWSSSYVSSLSGLLSRHQDAVLAVSLVGLIDGDTGMLKNEFWHPEPASTVGLPKAERFLRHLHRDGTDVGTYGHMVYGLFRRLPLLEENRKLGVVKFNFGIDVLLLLSLFGRGGLAVHPQRLFWYRTGGGSTTFRFENIGQWQEYRAYCSDLLLRGFDFTGLSFEDLTRVHKAQLRYIEEFTGGDSPFQADLIRKAMAG